MCIVLVASGLHICGILGKLVMNKQICLSLSQVAQLISSEQLNIISEEDVFNAVVLWVRVDMPTRQTYIAKVRNVC